MVRLFFLYIIKTLQGMCTGAEKKYAAGDRVRHEKLQFAGHLVNSGLNQEHDSKQTIQERFSWN